MRKQPKLHCTLATASTLIVLTLFPMGCRMGPNYRAPAVPVPPAFRDSDSIVPATPSRAVADGKWWMVFQDHELDSLEMEADSANRDIRIAVAHVDEAAAFTGATRSQLFPTVGTAPNVSRTREAQDRPNNGNTNGHAATYNDTQLPLILNYEIDAWGRVRRSLEAAQATQQASEADLRFVRLTTEATVAIDYYQLREDDQEIRVVDQTLGDLQEALNLTKSRFDHGLSSDLEVAEAQTLLDQTKASRQTLSIQREQSEHAIAVLIGRTAESLAIPTQPDVPAPPVIPVGLPADLLRRRPDISEADRNVASATAQIGVAKTAYFPQLSLTGLAGFESTNAASILTWQNSMASLGASAVAPIFTGGRLRAGVDQANAAYRMSLAQYEKTVLTSYQEVEDQLSTLNYLATQSHLQSLAVGDASRAERIATQRYKSGLVSYLDVVAAQQAVLFNERTATQIAGQRLVATVVLIKSLGGSWRQS